MAYREPDRIPEPPPPVEVRPLHLLCGCQLPIPLWWILRGPFRLRPESWRIIGKPTTAGETWYAHTVYLRCKRCRRVWCREKIGQLKLRRVSEEEAAKVNLLDKEGWLKHIEATRTNIEDDFKDLLGG